MAHLLHGDLTGVIRQTAFEVHCYFGNGFLEKVYKNALLNRLRRKGLRVDPKRHLAVRDEDGTIVGEYDPDLVVEERVIVELKAVRALSNNHKAQLLNYLKATGMRVGLLLNFGAERLQIKRYVYGPPPSASSVTSVVPACRGSSSLDPDSNPAGLH